MKIQHRPRIKEIITQGEKAFSQQFLRGIFEDYYCSKASGMRPWLFITLNYYRKYREQEYFHGNKIPLITEEVNSRFIKQFGSTIAKRFGAHIELFCVFDSRRSDDSVNEQIFPHNHMLMMVDEEMSADRLRELNSYIEEAWVVFDDQGKSSKLGAIDARFFVDEKETSSLKYIYLGGQVPVKNTFFCGGGSGCRKRRCDKHKQYWARRKTI